MIDLQVENDRLRQCLEDERDGRRTNLSHDEDDINSRGRRIANTENSTFDISNHSSSFALDANSFHGGNGQPHPSVINATSTNEALSAYKLELNSAHELIKQQTEEIAQFKSHQVDESGLRILEETVVRYRIDIEHLEKVYQISSAHSQGVG